jgi:TfoX N-terminal domain
VWSRAFHSSRRLRLPWAARRLTLEAVAFDEDLAERVREALPADVLARVTERKMFGGLAFMLDGNMVVGIVRDELMARLGPEAADAALERPHVREMDFAGRPMKGMVFVEPGALGGEELSGWVRGSLDFVSTLPPKVKAEPGKARRSTAKSRPGPK